MVVSTKIAPDTAHLLEAVRERSGDTFVSKTIRRAIHSEIHRHFPGAVKEAA